MKGVREMASKRNYKKLLKSFITLLLLVVVIISWRGVFPTLADTANYTDILKDLQKDSTFNEKDYPYKSDDYSIKVIQIAESVNGALYLYTYQPCQLTTYLIATDVNMALSDKLGVEEIDDTGNNNSGSGNSGSNNNQGTGGSSGDGFGGGGGSGRSIGNKTADTKLYGLTLVNTSGVFAKYLVNDIKVSSDKVRYYNITSIYRAWDKALDGTTGNNNTGDKKAFEVRNIYRVTDENGEKKYYCEPTYTVNILNPYSDYLLYLTSSSLPSIPSIKFNFERMGMLDAHYIAFSTDWEIDKLKSATVTYESRTGVGHYNTFLGFDCGGDISYSDPRTGYENPTYSDRAEYTSDFWHSGRDYSYSWDRIQTVPEFLATEKNLTDETKSNLEGKQWVLRFLETERTQKETSILGYKKYTTDFTKVDKVAVLRLEFETDGVCYNLGAVSDMVSGDDKPGNVEPKPDEQSIWDNIVGFFKNLFDKIKGFSWWQWLLMILGVILGIGLIVSLVIFGFKAVFKVIGLLIKYLFIGLWYLISAPFRFIAWIVRKIKGES